MNGLKIASAILELLLTIAAKVEQKNAEKEVQKAAVNPTGWFYSHFGLQQSSREETTEAGADERQGN